MIEITIKGPKEIEYHLCNQIALNNLLKELPLGSIIKSKRVNFHGTKLSEKQAWGLFNE